MALPSAIAQPIEKLVFLAIPGSGGELAEAQADAAVGRPGVLLDARRLGAGVEAGVAELYPRLAAMGEPAAYRCCAIIRHPYERLLAGFLAWRAEDPARYGTTLAGFLSRAFEERLAAGDPLFRPQTSFLGGDRLDSRIAFLCRFERLDADLAALAAAIGTGVRFTADPPCSAEERLAALRQLTAECQLRILRAYWDDFRLLDYAPEPPSPATILCSGQIEADEASLITNLSRGRPATQSSISPWSHGRSASEDAACANDGRPLKAEGFHTAAETDPWWQVDLGVPCRLAELRLLNRPDFAERLTRFSLLASDDGKAWRVIYARSEETPVSADPERPLVVQLPPGETARFVRVRRDGEGYLHFRQCEIYGQRLAPLPPAPLRTVLLQTSDAQAYFPLLLETAAANRAYCARHQVFYEAFIGVYRGHHPWQATFNRIPLLSDMLYRGDVGWVLFLDADAYVYDQEFDIAAFLAPRSERLLVAARGAGWDPWDINAGVFFLNLQHPLASRLIEGWRQKFATISDTELRAAEPGWSLPFDDQGMLQWVLSTDADLLAAIERTEIDFISAERSAFIRQVLRQPGATLRSRIHAAAKDIAATLAGGMERAPARSDLLQAHL